MHYCNKNRENHPTQKPEGLYERMILASSNEGDTILDPFSGSGTALRVCQNLNRNCIGIELNPEYVKMTKERLGKEFEGFDSIDERMERVPNDLNDEKIRNEYIENHKVWFLKNHESSLKDFINSVVEKYGKVKDVNKQVTLFDNDK